MPSPPPDADLPDLSDLTSPDEPTRNRAWDAAAKIIQLRLSGYYSGKGLDPQTARDLIQEVLKTLIRQLLAGRVATQKDLWPRIFTIAQTRWIDYLRHGRRHPEDAWADPAQAPGTVPPTHPSSAFENEALTRCLEKLPAPLLELVNLHFWEDLKQTEIAKQKERPEGTINYQIDKAKKLLKDCLGAARNPS